MRGAWLAAFGLLLMATTGQGQASDPPLEPYRNAVGAYQRGHFDSAADAVLPIPEAELRRIVAVVVRDARPRQTVSRGAPEPPIDPQRRSWLQAAAMLHTDLAVSGKVTTMGGIWVQMDLAQSVVGALPIVDPGTMSGRVRPPVGDAPNLFQQRWYAAAGNYFLAWARPDLAEPFIERGLRLFGDDARLRMLTGVVEEMRAHIENGNLHDRKVIASRTYDEARRRLDLAESHYRRARTLDPQMFEARLRLGRVLFLRRDVDSARQELQVVTSGGAPESLAYLAHLFLGALHESRNAVADARREYEAALMLAPQYQTSYIALSFLERMSGRTTRSTELLATFAALPKPAQQDPWWDYQNGMFDQNVLLWLRAQVAGSPR